MNLNNLSVALRAAAVICFALAALGVKGRVGLTSVGLALWCSSTFA